MSEARRSPGPSRDLEETHDDLEQASRALNTAYDRLQDLRTSFRNFNAQRDRLTERARQGARIRSADTMGPNHSAIVLSDSDEESEIDMDLLRESLPARLLELTSRLGNSNARLASARQSASADDAGVGYNIERSLIAGMAEQRPIYPPLRRRRALPPAVSSRDGVPTPPGPTSPARRSILEAHLRQFRHASNPTDATTTLGRRVAQRVAAVAPSSLSPSESSTTRSAAPSDTVVHSTLPSGIEPRPYTSGMESRAASHLRYSLLPTPPPGVRTSPGSRMSTAAGSPHPRFSERAEHRPRTARSNSFTALSYGGPLISSLIPQASTLDASTQTPLTPLGQLRTSVSLSDDDTSITYGDSTSGSYRVRRRINGQGEEHVFSINWGQLMSEADREEGLSDPATWLRPPQPSRTSRVRPGRRHSLQEPETDDTVVQEYEPFFIREGREGSVQRRRGWARLNADGDEISTEDEAILERSRADSRVPRARNWTRHNSSWGGSTVAVLDFVHRNSRDTPPGNNESHASDRANGETSPQNENSRRVIDRIFRPIGASAAYTSPLPVSSQCERKQNTKEVQVILSGRIAGR